MTFVNSEQAEYWASLAPTWVRLEEFLESTAGPPGRLAMDRLGLQPGESVMDLGCGTGATTVALAEAVAPAGTAVGIDISTEMLEAAQRRAAGEGVTNVGFVHADVQAHDFGASTFDAAFSRFGVMFYSEPVAAFTNVRSALNDGGRLSFVCWQSIFDNEWMLVPGMAVMSVTGVAPPMPAPGEPGPFSLTDPDRIRTILTSAGFGGIDVADHNDTVTLLDADIPEAAARSLEVGAARRALEDVDEATRQKALEAVTAALRDRVDGGEARLSRGVLVVTARA